MFADNYLEWNQRRIKCIIDFYGHKFFYQKKILDLGCGHADIGGALYRLGGDITAVDARQEHLNIANKKFQGIKTIKADLDQAWPFKGQVFDITLDLALLCHLRNFEQHLTDVCYSTNYLILETAVCDSDDPTKCITSSENKGIYDNSINGVSSRPSSSAIEQVLTKLGMTFQRMDATRLNSGQFIYDWYPKNNGDDSISKRRLWFINKLGELHTAHVSLPPFILTGGHTNNTNGALQNSHYPAHNRRGHPFGAQPRPPQTVPAQMPTSMPSLDRHSNFAASVPSIQYNASLDGTDIIKENSKRFAVITPESFTPSITFNDIKGTILPITISSKRWFKKVSPFFPNLLVQRKTISMQGFPKSDNEPNIVMCSLNHITTGKRVWIEEWPANILTDEHVSALKQCKTIMTPSLINMQELLQKYPEANITRVSRPWPLLNTAAHNGNYFIYLEKDSKLSKILFDSWQSQWGELVVVGSTIPIPAFAKYFSEYDDYTILLPYILGAKALIHLSKNTYYMSGIEQLARTVNLPVISNNTCQPDHSSVIQIPQDNILTSEAIAKAINRFLNNPHKTNLQLDLNYNQQVYQAMKTMVG